MPNIMKIGCPVLRVRNIDKVLAFYEKGLGLQVSRRYHTDDGNGDLVYDLDVRRGYQGCRIITIQNPITITLVVIDNRKF